MRSLHDQMKSAKGFAGHTPRFRHGLKDYRQMDCLVESHKAFLSPHRCAAICPKPCLCSVRCRADRLLNLHHPVRCRETYPDRKLIGRHCGSRMVDLSPGSSFSWDPLYSDRLKRHGIPPIIGGALEESAATDV